MSDRISTPFNEVGNDYMPKMGNAVTRWIGRSILGALGWSFSGKLPNEPKVIFIGAPHTSNWDLIIALAAMMSVSLKCSWMMKKEAFFWPLGGLWKALGGIPIDRSKKSNVTDQMVEWFDKTEKAWLGLTPEGTRSKVNTFKKGYLRMAYAADVPVFIIAVDGVKKQIALDRIWPLTGDIDQDNADIKSYYDDTYTGIRT